MPPTASPPDTRHALLRAAIRRFATFPYGDVTIRDIAADADVSAPLVMKYFGSKEQLFLAVADFVGDFTAFLDAPDGDLARHLVTRVMTLEAEPDSINPFAAMLFLASGRDTPPAGRDRLRSRFIAPLAARLEGEDRELRAELVCAELVGLSALLRALKSPGVAAAPPDRIVELVTPAIEQHLRPPADRAG
ncbi:MAG TPA: TetR family transcriptional regulator [Acidimicrobiales bacterium]